MLNLWNWIKSWFHSPEPVKVEPKLDHSAALDYLNKLARAKEAADSMGETPEKEARRRFAERVAELKAKQKEEEELREKRGT